MDTNPTDLEKSQIPGPHSSDDYDDAEFTSRLRNLWLTNSGGTCLNNNNYGGVVDSPSSFSVSSEQHVNQNTTFLPMSSCMSQEASPESPIYQDNNVWAYDYKPINTGGYLPSNGYPDYGHVTSPKTPMSSYSSYGSPLTPAKSLITSYSSYRSPSTPNMWDDPANVYNYAMGINLLHGNNLYPNYGVSFQNRYNMNNNGEQSSGSSVYDILPEGLDLVMMARTRTGSQFLCWLLGTGNNETRKRIFLEVFESIPELMTDPNGHHIFQKLVDSCKEIEFQLIVRKLTSENRFLVEAAFDKRGSYSIQKLIKRLRKSPMASLVTTILSTSFYDMMTHPIAMHVICQCLNNFAFEPNMVLFGEAINHCYTLATHHVGCRSMNNCIDVITGAQRERLLQLLADQSVFLANDPSGNYVVQRVLSSRNPLIVTKVCDNLRGQYKQVSRKKGGSHVVEMCIRYSVLGMTCAVQEFLKVTKELVQLAKDPFGNFVIQTALGVTKLQSIELYEALVKALKPHLSYLEHFRTGKCVVALIRQDLNHLGAREYGQEQAKLEERKEDCLTREG